MAAVIATSRRPAFNPFQFDRVSTAPHPVSSNACALRALRIPHADRRAVAARVVTTRARACPDTTRRSLVLRVFERCTNSQAPQPRRTKPGLPNTLVNWTPDGKGIVVEDREVFERKRLFGLLAANARSGRSSGN